MVSSDEGLGMLRNWHTKKTLLTLVSLALSDAIFPIEVRVGPEPPAADRLALTFAETGEKVTFDLAKSRLADANDEPPPIEAWEGRFAWFVFLELKDKRLFVLAERILVA